MKKKKKKEKQEDLPIDVDPVATNGSKSQRMKQLLLIAEKCNKALKTNGEVYLGKNQPIFERVPTGVVALDYVMGGGLVKGQLAVFTGAEGSFKTTAALIAVAAVQKAGGTAVWVAGEGFGKKWAAQWGVDLDQLVVITADTGDTAMEAAVTLIQSNLVDILVIDSIQSLGTTREMESGVDDEAYAGAGAPQMWGRVMRKIYAAMNKGANACIIGISQVRAPIGKYGVTEPEGSGIWALKHWKAIDIYFRKAEAALEGDASEKRRLSGRTFKVRCMKNKTSVSERQAGFDLRKKKDGKWFVDNSGTTLRLAKAYDLLEVKGSWVQGYGLRAQGDEKFLELLKEQPKVRKKILQDVFALTN